MHLLLVGDFGFQGTGILQCISKKALAPATGLRLEFICLSESVAWRSHLCAMQGQERTLDQWERSIDQLHAHALQGGGCGGNIQQVQDDWLVRPQHHSTGDHGGQGIANLACTGDRNALVIFHPSEQINLDDMVLCNQHYQSLLLCCYLQVFAVNETGADIQQQLVLLFNS